MIKRSEKLAFMEVGENESKVFRRMSGFTELSISKNPKEYSRKYIDENMERSVVVGYSPSISYKFDTDPKSSVHGVFKEVADKELLGEDATCSIIMADVSTANDSGSYPAIKRDFCIIPSSEGDDSDTYTCSGSLKAYGEKIFGTVITTDDWQTVTFTEE